MARDSDAATRTKTEVITSRTAELIFAANLVASEEGSRPGAPEGWGGVQRPLLPRSVQNFLPRLKDFWWPTMGLVDFLCHNGHFQDTRAFVDDLTKRPLDQFLATLLNGDLTPAEIGDLLQDPARLTGWLPRLSRFSRGTEEAFKGLLRDPEGHRQGLLSLLLASDTPWFQETFTRLTRESAATIKTIELRLAVEEPLSVAESLREKPIHHGSGDFDRYTFIPSRLIGHHHIQSWSGGHVVFFLQEGGLSLTGPTEAGNELAEFLKVLGDRTRMDILRLLCCGPSYGKEIAASLRLTTATVSRHLDQLKAAGLVKEDRADANNVKRLRYVHESLESQIDKLKAYLLHS